MSSAAPKTDPRLAVALARAEQRLEMLEQLAGMGMALARDLNQRAIEGPQRSGARDPARAFATVSRAVRLTLILEAKIEKQILAWRKGDLSSIDALILPPEPFLKRRTDSGPSPRERVRDAVAAVIDREAGDPNEAGRMHDRVQREMIETDHIDDYRLKGDFRSCVEAICSDLGLEPDWSLWDDEAGFAAEEAAMASIGPAMSTASDDIRHASSSRVPDESLDPVLSATGFDLQRSVTVEPLGPGSRRGNGLRVGSVVHPHPRE